MTSTPSAPPASPAATSTQRSSRGTVLRRLLSPFLGRYAGVLIGLLAVCVYLAATESSFLTWDNIENIIKSNSVVFILAIGTTFVLLTGGIDLSIASATAACLMILGVTLESGMVWPLAVLITILFGFVLGLVNGLLSGVAKISFLVVTLGTLSIYQSVALLINDGDPISLFSLENSGAINGLANDNVGPIPIMLIVWAILFLLAAGVLRYTRFGRSVFAVGANPEAARLTGVNVTLVLVSVFVISGLTAALAGIVQAGRLTSAAPTADPTLLLTVVAAVLIGGTAFSGGEGGVFGTLIGVLFLGVVQNGLTLSDVSTFWQGAVSGVILIAAVGLSVLRDRGWRLRTTPTRGPLETESSGTPPPGEGQGDEERSS